MYWVQENFLIFIDKVVHTSVEQDSDEYSKYFNLSKVGLTNGLFNTYDDYIKNKYEININKKALTTVKSYFN